MKRRTFNFLKPADALRPESVFCGGVEMTYLTTLNTTVLLLQSPVELIATRAITTSCEQRSNKTDFSGDKQNAMRIKVGIVGI